MPKWFALARTKPILLWQKRLVCRLLQPKSILLMRMARLPVSAADLLFAANMSARVTGISQSLRSSASNRSGVPSRCFIARVIACDACRMVTAIDDQRAYNARKQAEADRKAEEFAARSQRSYGATVPPSYSSRSSSSPSYSSSSSAQDNADFNAFINKVNSYGTGYSASCRSGNPYC